MAVRTISSVIFYCHAKFEAKTPTTSTGLIRCAHIMNKLATAQADLQQACHAGNQKNIQRLSTDEYNIGVWEPRPTEIAFKNRQFRYKLALLHQALSRILSHTSSAPTASQCTGGPRTLRNFVRPQDVERRDRT